MNPWFLSLAVLFISLGAGTTLLPTDARSVAMPAGTEAVESLERPFWLQMVPMAAVLAIFYFMLFRPQQKRLQEQDQLLASLKEGDMIVTKSGVIGKITSLSDKVIMVEIAERVRIKMLRSQVMQLADNQIKDALA